MFLSTKTFSRSSEFGDELLQHREQPTNGQVPIRYSFNNKIYLITSNVVWYMFDFISFVQLLVCKSSRTCDLSRSLVKPPARSNPRLSYTSTPKINHRRVKQNVSSIKAYPNSIQILFRTRYIRLTTSLPSVTASTPPPRTTSTSEIAKSIFLFSPSTTCHLSKLTNAIFTFLLPSTSHESSVGFAYGKVCLSNHICGF